MHQDDPGDEYAPPAPQEWRFDRRECPYCKSRKIFGPRRGRKWNDDRMCYCSTCNARWFQYETDELNVDPTKGADGW